MTGAVGPGAPGPPGPTSESPDALSGRILSSTAWNYVGYGSTLLVWFLLTPLVVSELGVHAYGLFVVATALSGYGQLFELGLSSAVTRFVADLDTRDDLDELRAIVATAFAIACGLAVLLTAIGLLLSPFAADLLHVPADQRETTRWLFVVAAGVAGVAFPSATLFALLHGLQRFDIANLMQIVSTLLLAGFTIGALLLDLGVVWVVAAGIPTSLAVQLPVFLAIRRTRPDLRLLAGRPRFSHVSKLLSFSWAIVVMQGATMLKTRTDEIVIAAMLPIARVTPYSLARRASEAPVLLTYQFAKVILPLAAQLGARDEHERLRSVFLIGTRVTLATYLAGACALTTLAGPFLGAWVGQEYRDASTILVVLAIASGVEMMKWTADSVLQGIYKHRPLAGFAIFGALLNLVLSIALIGPLGVTGVAVGTLIASAVEALLLTLPYSMRALEVGVGEVLRTVLLPVLVPVLPSLGVAMALTRLADPSSLPSILWIGLVSGMVYAGAYLAFGTTAPERGLILRGVQVTRRRFLQAS